jgi:putative membrane-bound dehydrogenase-like protein
MKAKFAYGLLAAASVAAIIAGAVFWLVTIRSKSPAPIVNVAEGFEVELVAGPPLVERPIVADFDEQGRLYVADSSGSNDKVQKQLEEKPHRIVRLEDTNQDGRFDKSVVFADKMMFPEGTLWFDGSLYVAAPPSIWKLTDTNEDGVADQREEWFQGTTLTNCANDLHGPYLGLDGWIYWAKGAFAKQTYERPGKPPFVTRASHIFRRRPGDTAIEPVMTGGMDNPVDVVFTPAGERILTSTFVIQPEVGRRDGLIHAVYGGVYGKQHNVINDHKKTGDLMPVMTHLGPAVPCGLTAYTSEAFGKEYQNNIFAALFNLHKVTRHVLEPTGATFTTRDSDFLVSSNPDFHPTDVLEDADGSLIVIDTGAWYKLCCPTSQLAKPDVLGAIYRVRRKGAPGVNDPRGLKIEWATSKPEALAGLLVDSRPAVRSRAMHQLSRQGSAAVPAVAEMLKTSGSLEGRRNAVWALTRIEGIEAREAVRWALKDQDETIRQAASHSAGTWRDPGAVQALVDVLKHGSPHLKRAAAEALGRIGDKTAIPELFALVDSPSDRVLEHSLTYALIEIGDPEATAAGLKAASPRIRRAALIALDQMDGGGLKPESITPLLTSSDALLKQTAWWIAGHHPDWGQAVAGFFRQRLASKDLSSGDRDELQRQLAQFTRDPEIQSFLASSLNGSASMESRLVVLRAMAQAPLKEMPAAWAAGFVNVMAGKDTELIRQTVSTARVLPPPPKDSVAGLSAALLRVACEPAFPVEVRLDALAAVPGGLSSVQPDLFQFLIAGVESTQPPAVRGNAATVLAKAKLSPDQLLALADSLKNVGPMELPKILAVYENASDEALGLKLVSALKQSKGVAVLRPDVLKPRLAKFPESVQKKGEELLASVNLDIGQQNARVDKLLVSLKGGDIRRGQAVFNSATTACSSCHTIGYMGGKLGPDLTRIGQIRTERDLLESIVFPNASFVRSYESVLVKTKSGEMHNGVLRKEDNDEVLLATDARTEVRIARNEIAEMRPGTVSVMPSGLDEQLTQRELSDLLAFLKHTRREAH